MTERSEGIGRSDEPVDGVLTACLRAAAAAPSIHNTQPWQFRVTGRAVDVVADRSRRLRVLDPDGRELVVSVGAAVFNLRVAVAASGFRAEVLRLPDGPGADVAARVTAGVAVQPSGSALALAAAIPRRHTNRRPFADRPIPYGVMEELRGAATAEGATLLDVGPDLRDGVIGLTRTAENRMRSDPGYLRELAAWTNPSSVGRADGLPRHVLGPRPRDGALPVRDLGIGLGLPTGVVEFEPDPTLLVLFTPGDTAADWLRAGEALQRVWLTATVRGVALTPMSQLTEISALRDLLTDSLAHQVPQLVLRAGYPLTPALPAPRRPLSELVR